MMSSMEFRRAEIKKVYRHVERISSTDDIRGVFQALYKNHLKFSLKVDGIGPIMEGCVVLSVDEDAADVTSRFPSKCRLSGLRFSEVELVEVVCNRELVSEEDDDGGRWARII